MTDFKVGDQVHVIGEPIRYGVVRSVENDPTHPGYDCVYVRFFGDSVKGSNPTGSTGVRRDYITKQKAVQA